MTIHTSDEGASFCSSCEAYARENEKLKAELEIAQIEWRRFEGEYLEAMKELAKNARLREALGKIKGFHGENECGMCASFDVAKQALEKP